MSGSTNFFTGVGAGIMVGTWLGMMWKPAKKNGKKAVGKAIKSIGDAIGEVSDMFGM